MSELYKTISDLCEQNGITGYKLCKEIKISPSVLTDLKMGRKKSLSADYAERISSYFGVSVSYLLGTETEKSPSEDGVTFDDFTYAMHGHSGDLTAADKDILLKLAAQMADTNRRIKDAETDGDLQ